MKRKEYDNLTDDQRYKYIKKLEKKLKKAKEQHNNTILIPRNINTTTRGWL